jgi:RNA polymerase sigma-70 factor (ECF subfamily)
MKGTDIVPPEPKHAAAPPSKGFETLVATHSAAIFAYLWRLLRDPADAEDCLQDTFLRAYRAYGRLDGHPSPQAWLYRIATNVARTRLKQRGREAVRTAALDPELVAAGPGPAEQAGQTALLAAVAAAVDALPPHQRAALILRQYQGLSYQQVAAVLDCTAEAARANVYQALKKLRMEVGGQKSELYDR